MRSACSTAKKLSKNNNCPKIAPLNRVLLCCLKSITTVYFKSQSYSCKAYLQFYLFIGLFFWIQLSSFSLIKTYIQIPVLTNSLWKCISSVCKYQTILKLFICQSIACSPNMSWPLKTKGWLHLNSSVFYTVACKDISTTSPLWNQAQVFITAKPLKSLWQHETLTGNIISPIVTQHTNSRSSMHTYTWNSKEPNEIHSVQ